MRLDELLREKRQEILRIASDKFAAPMKPISSE